MEETSKPTTNAEIDVFFRELGALGTDSVGSHQKDWESSNR